MFLLPLLMCFVAMATYSFHILIMGKVKVCLYFYLITHILTKVLQNYSLNNPLPHVSFLSNPLNLKAKCAKQYSKIISSEAIRGIKRKFCRAVHNISRYKTCVFIAVAHVFSLLWQLKVSIDVLDYVLTSVGALVFDRHKLPARKRLTAETPSLGLLQHFYVRRKVKLWLQFFSRTPSLYIP